MFVVLNFIFKSKKEKKYSQHNKFQDTAGDQDRYYILLVFDIMIKIKQWI